MNVKDLLMCLAPEDIAKEIVKTYNEGNTEYNLYVETIKRLRNMEPVDSGDIIIGVDCYCDGEKHFDVAMYKKDDVYDNLESLKRLAQIDNVHDLTDESLHTLAFSEGFPCSYAIDFAPWKSVLGSEIIEENAKQAGELRLCAAVVSEMTFCGFYESDAASILNEAEKIADSITEDAFKNAKPTDWLISDEISSDEIAINQREAEEEQLLYAVNAAKALIRFK